MSVTYLPPPPQGGGGKENKQFLICYILGLIDPDNIALFQATHFANSILKFLNPPPPGGGVLPPPRRGGG